MATSINSHGNQHHDIPQDYLESIMHFPSVVQVSVVYVAQRKSSWDQNVAIVMWFCTIARVLFGIYSNLYLNYCQSLFEGRCCRSSR